MKIPFSKTTLGEEEIEAVASVIRGGWVVLGEKSAEFEKEFAFYVGAKYAIFVDSGTSALFLAVKWMTRKEKGAVSIAVPSLTFVATPEVIVNAGHTPYFVDVNKGDFCLVKNEMTEIPNYSLPVDLLGNRSDLSAFVYDSAHRIEKGGFRGGIECHSFYATKNMSTVQGGMMVTNDEEAYEWFQKARDHGLSHGTKERYQGKQKKYEAEFVGFRVKGDDLRAVIGLEQLRKLPEITRRRNEIVARYNKNLGLKRTGNHVYPILVENREEFIAQMLEEGIQCAIHFRPIHLMKAYENFPREDLSVTERIGSLMVSLPVFPAMTDEEVDYVSEKVRENSSFLRE
ncbi:MAG: DegT/DnrJ/EryC1/StrS aminotransferase family protein [Patescibacteria group bacterium]